MRISDWSSDVCSSDLVLPTHSEKRSEQGTDRRFRLFTSSIALVISVPRKTANAYIELSTDSKLDLRFLRTNMLVAPIIKDGCISSRSEESRVGKQCVSTCKSRCSTYH